MNIKRTIKIVGLGLLVIILLLIVIGYFLLKNFNLNDGPFLGEVRNMCQLSSPNSTLTLTNGYRIESYPRAENEKSATVRLINGDNEIIWCIYAHGLDHSYVHSIEFTSESRENYGHITIYGAVDWTYGKEASIWHIENDGELIEYWYSW